MNKILLYGIALLSIFSACNSNGTPSRVYERNVYYNDNPRAEGSRNVDGGYGGRGGYYGGGHHH